MKSNDEIRQDIDITTSINMKCKCQVAYFSYTVDIFMYIHHVIGVNYNGPRGMFIGQTSGIELHSANSAGKL